MAESHFGIEVPYLAETSDLGKWWRCRGDPRYQGDGRARRRTLQDRDCVSSDAPAGGEAGRSSV